MYSPQRDSNLSCKQRTEASISDWGGRLGAQKNGFVTAKTNSLVSPNAKLNNMQSLHGNFQKQHEVTPHTCSTISTTHAKFYADAEANTRQPTGP